MSIEKTRIVFMGMAGPFSLIPFRALLQAGANVVGLLIPRPTADREGPRRPAPDPPPTGDLPVLPSPVSPSPTALARGAGIPVWEVGALPDPRSHAGLAAMAPDLMCVAGCPRWWPPAGLSWARLGCLQVPASLLPAYRGPAPLFWQFRAGETRTGVTLHRMDARADSGPILAHTCPPAPLRFGDCNGGRCQGAPVGFPDGISGAQAD
jgi:methionyl-tRNA formyltransferase